MGLNRMHACFVRHVCLLVCLVCSIRRRAREEPWDIVRMAPEIFFPLLHIQRDQAKTNLADKLCQISANLRCNGRIFNFPPANPPVGHGSKQLPPPPPACRPTGGRPLRRPTAFFGPAAAKRAMTPIFERHVVRPTRENFGEHKDMKEMLPQPQPKPPKNTKNIHWML